MKLRTLTLSSLALVSVFAVAGCAADTTEPEATAETADELNAEKLFCLVWDCHTSNWQKLGETDVNGDLFGDHDRVDVDRDGARFSKIQLRVRGGDAVIDDIVVTFRNGDRHRVGESFDVEEDDRSETIPLPGNRRAIRSVSFRASRFHFGGGDNNNGPSFPFPFPFPGGGDVTVEVWGKR